MYSFIRYFKRNKIKPILIFSFIIGYSFCLPMQLFKNPIATNITSSSNELLVANIAEGDQSRSIQSASIPYKFKTCILPPLQAYSF